MAVLHQIRRNFHYRDRFTFVPLYKQYVRPHLEFASQAWAPWLAGDQEVLEKVQKKAVGMVSGLKGKSYEERCAELGLETLETRRIKQDMSLVHISSAMAEEKNCSQQQADTMESVQDWPWRRMGWQHHLPGQTSENTRLQYGQWSTGRVFQREQERRTVSNLSKNC
jgi:hypothetical protein